MIARISASHQGPKFDRLMAGDLGDYGTDHSSADLALCSILAGWCDDDAGLMDGIVRSGGLMRPKWDQKRGAQTYGRRTIDRALATVGWRYDGWHAPTITLAQPAHQTAPETGPGDVSCPALLAAALAEVARLTATCDRLRQECDAARANLRAFFQTLDNPAAKKVAPVALLVARHIASHRAGPDDFVPIPLSPTAIVDRATGEVTATLPAVVPGRDGSTISDHFKALADTLPDAIQWRTAYVGKDATGKPITRLEGRWRGASLAEMLAPVAALAAAPKRSAPKRGYTRPVPAVAPAACPDCGETGRVVTRDIIARVTTACATCHEVLSQSLSLIHI